jgi:hypothetical protein
MKIESLIIADAAQAVGGKLYILGGGWNMFRASSYPAMVPLAIAIDLSLNRNELGVKHPLTVVIADDVGVPIVPQMNGLVEVGKPTEDIPKDAPIKFPVAFNAALQVPRPGRYTVVVTAGASKAHSSFQAIFVGNRVEFSAQSAGSERGN